MKAKPAGKKAATGRRARPASRLQLAAGRHAAAAALTAGSLRELLAGPGAPGDLIRAVRGAGIGIVRCSRARLDRLAGTPKHQNVIAVCASRPQPGWRDMQLGDDALLLAFDGVQDPRNIGACLRNAAAFGVSALLVPRRNSASLSPAARKTAVGGDFSVPLQQVSNMARELRALRDAGFRVFCADAAAKQELYRADLTGPAVWVFGSEQSGLRRITRDICDLLVSIPLPQAAAMGSLNVSVACGICLAETIRQRRGGRRNA
ncbi:MAG: 23S rRNA (guanosine(2251)-2'-O)-methyltransferase RlmB [Betaproteobacteria bacterium]|nr:23S rRNA (guanosine(2251)-2'-O)-methyltransferase RlmB [Betaproteobacteria bacterium]